MSSAALTALTLAVPSAVAKDAVDAVTANAAVDPETAALAPPRDLAAAVGEQGRGAFDDAFTGVSVDRKNNQVIVYGTDGARSRKMTGAAQQKHAGIDTGRVKYVTAKYSRKDLDASLDRTTEAARSSDAAHLEVYGAAAAPDGSGIPVTATAGEAPQPFTRRWNDGRAFIGGNVPIGDGNPSVGSWSSLSRGGYTGFTGSDHPQWDAQTTVTDYCNGNGTDSDEADQPEGRWYAVTSAAYSYDGDSVCQDGARPYYDGHGVPCGITGSSTRQARGIVSGGEGGTLYRTEAPDILDSSCPCCS
ncbi:hypothetical protein [Kitasatospora phosalacinea]|uniref:hypothetical protein n=1 Tax=Kitasatospora phosalacinea TaxID=2065 RepID=UPI0025570CA8|nr:hypothetical protein [Kitasatospora phosalacinea]